MQPDGAWTSWNPVAEAQDNNRRAIMHNATAALPEWEVSLWRDPAVSMLRFDPIVLPSGTKTYDENNQFGAWRFAMRARRGGFVQSTWKPVQLNKEDVFPIIDTLPTTGYQQELHWDMQAGSDTGPLQWDKPIGVYWRRSEQPERVMQVILTPFWDDSNRGKRDRLDADQRHFTFGVRATIRMTVEPSPILNLALYAQSTPANGVVPGRSPSWFRWADRPFLERLMAVPEPGK